MLEVDGLGKHLNTNNNEAQGLVTNMKFWKTPLGFLLILLIETLWVVIIHRVFFSCLLLYSYSSCAEKSFKYFSTAGNELEH